jgi:hypothetical protein
MALDRRMRNLRVLLFLSLASCAKPVVAPPLEHHPEPPPTPVVVETQTPAETPPIIEAPLTDDTPAASWTPRVTVAEATADLGGVNLAFVRDGTLFGVSFAKDGGAAQLMTMGDCGQASSWTPFEPAPPGAVNQVFQTSQGMVAATDQGVFVLTDGATGWLQGGKGLPKDAESLAVAGDSPALIWNETLYRSTDGGKTFTTLALPSGAQGSVAITDDGAIVATRTDLQLVPWKGAPKTVRADFHAAHVRNVGPYVVADAYADDGSVQVLTSKDGGQSWSESTITGVTPGFTAAYIGDQIVVPAASVLYTSADGATWTTLPADDLPAMVTPRVSACRDEVLYQPAGEDIYAAPVSIVGGVAEL